MDQEQLARYLRIYNRLPQLEEAYTRLKAREGYKQVIKQCLNIIAAHDIHDILGVFLLHRHFSAQPRALFLERRYTPRPGHKAVLVTAPTSPEKMPARYAAHRLRIGRSPLFEPLEFTTDRAAIEGYTRVTHSMEFREEFSRFVTKE